MVSPKVSVTLLSVNGSDCNGTLLRLPEVSGKPGRLLWEDVSGSSIDFVPVRLRQLDLARVGYLFDSIRVRRPNHRLYFRRVALDPGDCHSSLGNPIGRTQVVQYLVQLGVLGAIHEYALKEAVLEWRPCLNGDFLEAAIVKDASVMVDRIRELCICADPTIDHSSVGDAKLQLINLQLHRKTGLQ